MIYMTTLLRLVSVVFLESYSVACFIISMYIVSKTRQIIRYRETATVRRPQIKQYTASNEGGGGLQNKDKVWSGAPNGRFVK